MNNKNKIVGFIIFVVVAFSIIAGVILVNQKQFFTEKAAPTTNLTFSPASLNVMKGQSFTTDVKVSTGTNSITGVDIEILYNPATIQLTQLVPTAVLSNFTNIATGQVIKNEINNTTGNARFIAYVINKNLGVTGQQNILAISGTVASTAAPATYQINYGGLTSIAALNESQNAILSKSPLSITVTSPTPIPTVSPIPTPTRSPSPSPTASPIAYPNWDVDESGTITIVDIGIVVDDYGNPNPVRPRADVDKNGTINIVDIGIIVDHYQ